MVLRFGDLGNVGRPGEAAPPVPQERPKDVPLGDRTFALYCDGKLVPVEPADIQVADGNFSITFTSAVSCLDGATDARVARAWQGFKAGDRRYIVRQHPQPDKQYPDYGYVQLKNVLVSDEPGVEPTFEVLCITPVYDWAESRSLGNAGDLIRIPASYFLKGHD